MAKQLPVGPLRRHFGVPIPLSAGPLEKQECALLAVTHLHQQWSQLCWATSAAMILRAHGVETTRCRVATRWFGGVTLDEELDTDPCLGKNPWSDLPENPDCCVREFEAACNLPIPSLADVEVLFGLFGMECEATGRLEWDEIRTRICSGPLLFAFQTSSCAFHLEVAHACRTVGVTEEILFHDPAWKSRPKRRSRRALMDGKPRDRYHATWSRFEVIGG